MHKWAIWKLEADKKKMMVLRTNGSGTKNANRIEETQTDAEANILYVFFCSFLFFYWIKMWSVRAKRQWIRGIHSIAFNENLTAADVLVYVSLGHATIYGITCDDH